MEKCEFINMGEIMKTYDIDKKMIEIIQKRIIDEKDLVDYIHRKIKQNLNKIIFINDGDTCFRHNNGELLINFRQLLDDANELFINNYLTRGDKDIFINMWILTMIIHEMEHIKQRSYLYGGTRNYLENYIRHEIIFSATKISDDKYDEYHDYFLYERLATFSAFGSIFDIFSQIDLSTDLYDCFLQYMLYYLETGYEKIQNKIKSPLETTFELMQIKKSKIKNLIIKENMSILEKAEFGLPLNIKQYTKIRTKMLSKYY